MVLRSRQCGRNASSSTIVSQLGFRCYRNDVYECRRWSEGTMFDRTEAMFREMVYEWMQISHDLADSFCSCALSRCMGGVRLDGNYPSVHCHISIRSITFDPAHTPTAAVFDSPSITRLVVVSHFQLISICPSFHQTFTCLIISLFDCSQLDCLGPIRPNRGA
jgi:hypothetical protein